MSSSSPQGKAPGTARARLIAYAIGALVLVIALVLVLRATRGDDHDQGKTASSSGVTPSTSASASASPSATPTKPSRSPSPAGKKTGAASSSPTTGAVNSQPPLRPTFKQAARPIPALQVDVARVEQVESKAEVPGELSRPSLRITIRVHNVSNKAVPIKTALANLYYGANRTPAGTASRPGAKAFPSNVPAGGTVTGIYLFNVPVDQRRAVVLEVILDAQFRRIEFSGNCSGTC